MRRDLLLEHFLLGAVCFATSTTARASHSNRLFQRASTCADTSFTKCSQSGLPANFCCGPDTVCIPLAANTTVLCCPTGRDCSSIVPIPCDITQQNATLHPDNALKTTALTSTLATCGSECCPFGYTCNDGVCDINPNQNFPPPPPSSSAKSSSTAAASTAKSTASSTALTSISPTPTPTATSTPQTSDTSTLPVEKTCDKFPAGAVLAGFFPGIALGIGLALAWVCFLGARRKKYRRSESSFGNPNPSPALSKISEPQLIRGDFRTDFLKKQPQTPSSVASSPMRQGSLHRVKSLFRKSTSSNSTYPPQTPVPPIPLNYQKPRPAPRPVTPPLQREPSYEDINIFADGDTASALQRARQEGRESHQTTFSDMMQRSGLAGLQKGQPYVYRGNSTEQQSPPSQRNISPRGKEI